MARRLSVHAFGRFRVAARGARGLGIGLGLAGLVAGAAACAPMKPYNPDRLPQARMDDIGQICRNTLGISGGTNAEYMACEESLSHSFAARLQAGTALAVRRNCEAQGLQPGSVALSKCELRGAPVELAEAGAGQGAGQGVDPPATRPAKSYSRASNEEDHRRMQEACADIGYDPVASGFGQCVADLQASLFDADNSAH